MDESFFAQAEVEFFPNVAPGSAMDEDPEDAARRRGLNLVLSRPGLLMLDLDSNEAEATALSRFEMLQRNWHSYESPAVNSFSSLRTTSQNGHAHLYILFNGAETVEERLMYQGALGSDGNRELLTALRITLRLMPGKEICLFETDEELKRVEEWMGKVGLR